MDLVWIKLSQGIYDLSNNKIYLTIFKTFVAIFYDQLWAIFNT